MGWVNGGDNCFVECQHLVKEFNRALEYFKRVENLNIAVNNLPVTMTGNGGMVLVGFDAL